MLIRSIIVLIYLLCLSMCIIACDDEPSDDTSSTNAEIDLEAPNNISLEAPINEIFSDVDQSLQICESVREQIETFVTANLSTVQKGACNGLALTQLQDPNACQKDQMACLTSEVDLSFIKCNPDELLTQLNECEAPLSLYFNCIDEVLNTLILFGSMNLDCTNSAPYLLFASQQSSNIDSCTQLEMQCPALSMQ
jgi:hypothetical protein